MLKWINENSGLVGIFSPILIAILIFFGSKYFVTNERYDADRISNLAYQEKNDATHEKMYQSQQDILKVIIKQADQDVKLVDHEARLRYMESVLYKYSSSTNRL